MANSLGKIEELKSIDHPPQEQIERIDSEYIVDTQIHIKALLKSQQNVEKYMQEIISVATLQEKMAIKLDEMMLTQERILSRVSQSYSDALLKHMEWELSEAKNEIERLVRIQQKKEKYFSDKVKALEQRIINLECSAPGEQLLMQWKEDEGEYKEEQGEDESMPF